MIYKVSLKLVYNNNKIKMIIKKTNVWGQFHNVKNIDKRPLRE